MSYPKDFDELAAMSFTEIEDTKRTALGWFLWLIIQEIKKLAAR